HIGFMIFGISLSSEAGMAAAIFYVVHHITVQTTLFLVAGLIERRGGTTSLAQLGGLAKIAPLLAVLFFVPAMNLAGIPPFSGFLGKVGLLQAGVAAGTPMTYTLVAGGVVTSLLTLYALIKAWNKAFWQTAPAPVELVHLPRGMVGSAAALAVFGISLTFVAGPLYAYTERAAYDLRDRAGYIAAVLPDGGRGTGVSNQVARDEAAVTDRAETVDPTAPGATP
ncbi:MAG: proton-conducting transporter membrane subunit, partial [Cellulomonas sp.]